MSEQIIPQQPVTETPQPAVAPSRSINRFAIAGFLVSLLSFSIGTFNLAWGWGLAIAIIGLGLSIFSFRRPGGRLWSISGIIISALFLILTFVLSALLGLSLSTLLKL